MDRIAELIASLDAAGFESPYLDRLKRRREGARARGGLEAIRQEILSEMAASLGRAEEHINEALLRLDVLEREIAALAREPARREQHRAKVAEFNAAREVAQKRIWELTVQRECIGLFRHDHLASYYPVPPKK